ncbi:MAG: hypothetical protein VBE63_00440 [Lamprobacter sp.]|uniref:flagellin N-terminal helical domain-containing protein n=1 Tax=Lamprobacter sp. TaxID=3100796 RepID=UPI002B25CDAB|nr:hypothetical protein [Lamprobacter sp.]MEA3638395.1 hypothetical protein [Lamprobacter sp.]
MAVVNTNVASLIAQRNFSKSSQATSMDRLSLGMRINSAKDDAAGQAIANRLTAQVRGLAQSQSNANDGISLAQTAEGALDQINDNVQRIRELTVQAKNDTNNRDDLRSIQGEITQHLTEIDRISADTDFNGTKVLARDTTLAIQVGPEDGQQIPIDLPKINTKTLDHANFSVAGFLEVNTDQLQSIFGAELQTTIFEQAVGCGTVNYSVDAASGAVTNEAGNIMNVATNGTLTEDASETLFPITASASL